MIPHRGDFFLSARWAPKTDRQPVRAIAAFLQVERALHWMAIVVAYDLDGHILQECSDAGRLTSPWGLAIAPQEFGAFGGSLLVGSFGDSINGGTIAAFDLSSGTFQDYLRDESGKPISIEGLWGLAFGTGVTLGDADSLYFTAGPNREQDGILGRLRYSSRQAR